MIEFPKCLVREVLGNVRNDRYLEDVPRFGRHFLLGKKPSHVHGQTISGEENCEGKAPEEGQALRSVDRREEFRLLAGCFWAESL